MKRRIGLLLVFAFVLLSLLSPIAQADVEIVPYHMCTYSRGWIKTDPSIHYQICDTCASMRFIQPHDYSQVHVYCSICKRMY